MTVENRYHLPPLCLHHPIVDMQEMQQSRAADIPEELFAHILRHACRIDYTLSPKTSILALSVVNRYWARLTRRELFCDITLRSAADASRLLEIVDAPVLPGLEYVDELIETLIATPDSREMPWLHTVVMTIIPKLWNFIFLSVVPSPSGGMPWRTLHPSLPRSLPGSLMPIEELRLEGVHFPNSRVLSRLLSSVPSLHNLDAYNLTFDTPPTADDLCAPPFGRKIYEIASDNLQLCLSFIPLLVANVSTGKSNTNSLRRGRSRRSSLDEEDLEILGELIGIFEAAPSFKISNTAGSTQHGTSRLNRPHYRLCLPDLPFQCSSSRSSPDHIPS